jgi:hypothetical protein
VALVVIAVVAALVAISRWVWLDAERRGMNPRWGIGVALMLIVFLPLYFAVRRPVKCANCGKDIDSSLSLCEECEALPSGDPSEGRAGRILG